MDPIWIVLIIVVVIGGFVVLTYNGLIQRRNVVDEAWNQISVQLKRRHDLIPNLVNAVKGYMDFEQETLTKVIEARSKVFAASQQQNMPALGQAETQLRLGLANLFAVAEAYPDLKTNEQFLNLEARISALENAIADRREFYNESVNINNVRIEQFPDGMVARMFDFPPRHLLQFQAAEKTDVDVKQLFAA